jgi:hypothetical protein
VARIRKKKTQEPSRAASLLMSQVFMQELRTLRPSMQWKLATEEQLPRQIRNGRTHKFMNWFWFSTLQIEFAEKTFLEIIRNFPIVQE